MGPWYVRPVLLALAAAALVSPRVLRLPIVWGIATIAIVVRIASDWPLADNHIYLLGYWTLAIALALRSTDWAHSLAITSRRLLGLSFICAVFWKCVLSPDFLDGRFFRVTLLTDPRFGEATMLLTGLSTADLEHNRGALEVLPAGTELLDPPPLVEPRRLQVFATIATWSIVMLEALVATLMFVTMPGVLTWLKHASLLGFCAVTYAFAPVSTFGWILLTMGMAQTDPSDVWLRRLYFGGVLAVLIYAEVPWAGLILGSG
jgi:hypothetical protein